MNMEILEQAWAVVSARWPDMQPVGGMVLGSGWSEVAAAFTEIDSLPYEDLPGLGRPGVDGHAGRLTLAELDGYRLLIFQGRRHLYEGEGWTPIALPIYLLKRAQAQVVLLTNSAGGMDAGMKPGDLMVVKDHINMMGSNPLVGPHRPFWGARFPDQTHVYDRCLVGLMEKAGHALGIPAPRGVYLAVSGPTYETPAEVQVFALLGAQAVGMSTVPEAILANAAGLKVAALSCITNLAAGITAQLLHHEEVTQAAREAMPRMKALLAGFWKDVVHAYGRT